MLDEKIENVSCSFKDAQGVSSLHASTRLRTFHKRLPFFGYISNLLPRLSSCPRFSGRGKRAPSRFVVSRTTGGFPPGYGEIGISLESRGMCSAASAKCDEIRPCKIDVRLRLRRPCGSLVAITILIRTARSVGWNFYRLWVVNSLSVDFIG